MSWNKIFGVALLSLFAQLSVAASFVNTSGSADGVAISGFDTVAFFTEKKALQGRPEYRVEWMDAKWLFASQQNMELFKTNPEKYAPQYGGHCPWCVSENCICGRPVNGEFEVIDGKLYLFPDGNKGRSTGVKNAWWRTGGGPDRRIPNGERNWPGLKAKLEAQQYSSTIPAQVPNPAVNMDAAR